MTAARKLTHAELEAWSRFASDALAARAMQFDRQGLLPGDDLVRYAIADADVLVREWRRRAGRDTISALRREQWRRDHGGKP